MMKFLKLMMNKIGTIVILSFLILSACKTQMGSTWKDEAYEVEHFDKILVVGNSPNVSVRHAFERELTEKISKKGVTAIASLDVLPKDEKISKEAFYKYFKDENIDAILVTRLVDMKETAEFVEGETYVQPVSGYYGGFYTYYHNVYREIPDASHFETTKVYQIETNLFKVEGEKLVWHALSEAYNPTDALEIIDDLAKNIAKKLSDEGYLGK
jgi:hypothetical protein